MSGYIIRRILTMIPTLIVISIVSFIILQLPPGDFLTTYAANLAQTGEAADEALLAGLRAQYGLDRPLHEQYWRWISGVVVGDLGQSFDLNRPVNELIWDRLGLTVLIALMTMVVTWIIAIPIGIYSATHQYKLFDYVFTFIGFFGMSIPGFLLALLLMVFAYEYFGTSFGLFSDQYLDAPWSVARFVDLMKHIWVPVGILGVQGTAGLIRTMRANLLDQLQMPYVVTARAKGLSERRLLIKYPVRVAINPVISSIGWMLPFLFSGDVIVATVLNLPTVGTLLLTALKAQDMYLAGSIIMVLATLTVIGTLVSDILLAWVDPRIRFEGHET